MTFKAIVRCEDPNANFGSMEFEEQQHPLSPQQLLRGESKLRHTEYIYGAVIFTGRDTIVVHRSRRHRRPPLKMGSPQHTVPTPDTQTRPSDSASTRRPTTLSLTNTGGEGNTAKKKKGKVANVDKIQFVCGDLVTVKDGHHDRWPALITEAGGDGTHPGSYYCMLFGKKKEYLFGPGDIKPFDAKGRRAVRTLIQPQSRQSNAYKDAVAQIFEMYEAMQKRQKERLLLLKKQIEHQRELQKNLRQKIEQLQEVQQLRRHGLANDLKEDNEHLKSLKAQHENFLRILQSHISLLQRP